MTSKASAYLYCNGNAIYFDESGDQISEFQRHDLCGLHLFVEKYPDAPVHWSIWEESNHEINKNILPWLLRCLRKKPAKRPK